MIQFLKKFLVPILFVLGVNALSAQATSSTAVAIINYASFPAYSSTASVFVSRSLANAGHVQFCDTSGKLIQLAFGPVGSEKYFMTNSPSSCIIVDQFIPINTNISYQGMTQAVTTGFGTVSFLP